MKKYGVIAMIAVVSLTVLACSFTIPGLRILPKFMPDIEKIEPGPMEEKTIQIPAPEGIADLEIGFGAGQLRLAGGGSALVTGIAGYNVEQLRPVIEHSGSRIVLRTGDIKLESIPIGWDDDLKNEWNLQLGSSPMNLELNVGAAKANIDLGGIELRSFDLNVGAADIALDFSKPNPAEMDRLDVEAGAAHMELMNLANAHAHRIMLSAAGGDFRLDFNGDIERDLLVEIEMAAGNVDLIFPEGVPVEVTVDGALVNVSYSGTWEKEGICYLQEGEGPSIFVSVTASAGGLNLISE
jgi:hypothetical protein